MMLHTGANSRGVCDMTRPLTAILCSISRLGYVNERK